MFDPMTYSALKAKGTVTIVAVAANVAFVTQKQFDTNTGVSVDSVADSVNIPQITGTQIPQLQASLADIQAKIASLQTFVSDANAITPAS